MLHPGTDGLSSRVAPGNRRLVAGRSVPEGTKVVTFVARCLDRLRGFDRFVRLAAHLQREDFNTVFVAVGQPVAARGIDPISFGQDYLARALAASPLLEPDRFWALGSVAASVVHDVLAASDLHVYPSRTYPVSASLLEAMSHSCIILASDDAPVREVLQDGVTGLLVPPADDDAWARRAKEVLTEPAGHHGLGRKAAELVRSRYCRDVTLPELARLLCRLANG